jgi:hypothetical protein
MVSTILNFDLVKNWAHLSLPPHGADQRDPPDRPPPLLRQREPPRRPIVHVLGPPSPLLIAPWLGSPSPISSPSLLRYKSASHPLIDFLSPHQLFLPRAQNRSAATYCPHLSTRTSSESSSSPRNSGRTTPSFVIVGEKQFTPPSPSIWSMAHPSEL